MDARCRGRFTDRPPRSCRRCGHDAATITVDHGAAVDCGQLFGRFGFEGGRSVAPGPVKAVAAVAQGSTPIYAAGRSTFCTSLVLGAVSEQGRRSPKRIRRCALLPTGPCVARVSMWFRWHPVSRATRIQVSGATWRCPCATSPPLPRSTSWSTWLAASMERIRSYLEALGTGATGKEAGALRTLRSELGMKDDPSLVRYLRANCVAAARAGGGAGLPSSRCARSSKLSAADRRIALDTIAFIKIPPPSKAMLQSVEPTIIARAGHMVAVEPMSTIGRPRPAAALKAAGLYDPETMCCGLPRCRGHRPPGPNSRRRDRKNSPAMRHGART